ncbi:MAG: hypothetical protein JSV62_06350 [Promethearchaeota archaeon]|nr:MAG: hypothetical protein JSV62_06350 [Candidatus Lokiarchaeota archaeon]
MTNSVVTRTLGMDFIYFDLIFLSIWIYFLIKKKYKIPILWGFLGWLAYIIADYVLWYLITQTRLYSGPIGALPFFLWFCFSPGFVMFSYVIVMFEKRNLRELIFWTSLFFIGWISVACGSQLIPLDDRIIEVSRNMNIANQRLNEIIMVLINIIVALILYLKKKLRLEDIIYIFLIGTLVEFSLELSLSVSGIRQAQGTWSLFLLIINTLLEFNLGIVLMYVLWVIFKIKRYKHYYYQMSYKDFKHIKTNFDAVASICKEKSLIEKHMKEYSKLYKNRDFLSDIEYYCRKYNNENIYSDLETEIKSYWN